MNKEKFLRFLRKSNACNQAIKWTAETNNLKVAWQQCEHGDWMLWLIRKIMNNDDSSLRKLTLAKARCARLIIHLMKDERSKVAVEIAEKFGNGEATKEELAAAAYAAADAAADAYAADAAAYAAADAYADDAAAYDAAYAAADAAAYAYDAARKSILLQCANIIRELYNYDEILAMIEIQ